ncbi:MAG: hypothetical protein ACP5L1_08380 [Caldivirga sp.]
MEYTRGKAFDNSLVNTDSTYAAMPSELLKESNIKPIRGIG